MKGRSYASLNREIAQLQRRAAIGRRAAQITPLGRWTIPGAEQLKEQVETARRLGFVVEVRFDGDVMYTTAKSWVQV